MAKRLLTNELWDQPEYLHTQRHEGDKKDQADQADEQPSGQQIAGRPGFRAPQPARDPRNSPAVVGHQRVGEFRNRGRQRNMTIESEQPASARPIVKRLENRTGTGEDLTVGLDQMDRLGESIVRHASERVG